MSALANKVLKVTGTQQQLDAIGVGKPNRQGLCSHNLNPHEYAMLEAQGDGDDKGDAIGNLLVQRGVTAMLYDDTAAPLSAEEIEQLSQGIAIAAILTARQNTTGGVCGLTAQDHAVGGASGDLQNQHASPGTPGPKSPTVPHTPGATPGMHGAPSQPPTPPPSPITPPQDTRANARPVSESSSEEFVPQSPDSPSPPREQPSPTSPQSAPPPANPSVPTRKVTDRLPPLLNKRDQAILAFLGLLVATGATAVTIRLGFKRGGELLRALRSKIRPTA